MKNYIFEVYTLSRKENQAMCHFVSWVEKDSKVYFLTGEKVYKTRKGKELQKHSGNIEDDKLGHGAIRFYFDLEGGNDMECTDFSDTRNIPVEIVTAIKNGKMRGMVAEVHSLLTTPAWKAYEETKARKAYESTIDTADKAYQEDKASALKAYRKAKDTAWKAYQEAIDTACQAHEKDKASAWRAYEESIGTADKAYEETIDTADKAYEETIASAWQAYEKAIDTAFWDLFADPNNRVEAWR